MKASLVISCLCSVKNSGGYVVKAFSSSPQPWRGHFQNVRGSKSKTLNQIDLVTFDLDNTLFPVDQVIQDANRAMLRAMMRVGATDASLERFTASMKRIRSTAVTQQPASQQAMPISYSELRLCAIEMELERCLPPVCSIDPLCQTVFDAWLQERHASAERHIFPFAIEALQQIRETCPNVIIGAITNGRGSPLYMHNTLQPYFDFSVSGEDHDVFPHRKPHPRIFEVSLERASAIRRNPVLPSVNYFELLKSRWIHVGDDLTNDVGASAACGARAIWITTSVEESSKTPFWSTASEEETQKRRAGAQEAMRFVDARISCLSELCDAISSLQVGP